jgi:hypothetical protein
MRDIICFRHILTPVALLKTVRRDGNALLYSSSLYVFGLRIAYWTREPE